MQFAHELIVPEVGFSFKLFLFEGREGHYHREKHWHRSIEIFAVCDGELEFKIDEKTGLQKQEAKKVLDAYIEIVTERMSENEEIVLVGFGTLIPRPQTQRLARNPKTGTPVMIPARTTVKFKPGKFLLEAMNAHLK